MKLHQIAIAILALCNYRLNVHGYKNKSVICGRRLVKHQALIVDGYASQQGFWPWHAIIYHFGDDWNKNIKCGGTLLNSHAVLTAAHCVYENSQPIVQSRVAIELGTNNLINSGPYRQDFQAFQLIPHPNYVTSNLTNVIAIILLRTQVTFSDYVQPICLWNSNKTDLSEVVGKPGTVVGFGVTKTDQISYILQQAVMPVVNVTTCLNSDSDFYGKFLNDFTFCAGSGNGTTACNGDSGGSLVFDDDGVFRIRGIVSLTQARTGEHLALCKVDNYVVFTDVAQYLQWIEDNLSELPLPPTSSKGVNAKTDGPTAPAENITLSFNNLIQSGSKSGNPFDLRYLTEENWQNLTNIDVRLFNYVVATIWSQWFCSGTWNATDELHFIEYMKQAKESFVQTSTDIKEYEFVWNFRNLSENLLPRVTWEEFPSGSGEMRMVIDGPIIVPTVSGDFDVAFLSFLQKCFDFMNLGHRDIANSCDLVISFRQIRNSIFDLNDEKLIVFLSEFSSNVFTFASYLSLNFPDRSSVSWFSRESVSVQIKSVFNYMIQSLNEIKMSFGDAFPGVTFEALKFDIDLLLLRNECKYIY